MKKFDWKRLAALALALLLSFALAACGAGPDSSAPDADTAGKDAADDAGENTDAGTGDNAAAAGDAAGEDGAEPVESKGTITIAASPVPHAEILAKAAELLAAQGWTLEVTEFEDYIQPNLVVDSGQFDANYFQHIPYLDDFNEQNGTQLVNAGGIHYEPFGIYPGTKSSLDELEEGDTIAVPNDTTNEARAAPARGQRSHYPPGGRGADRDGAGHRRQPAQPQDPGAGGRAGGPREGRNGARGAQRQLRPGGGLLRGA